MAKKILVVDDSALMRSVLCDIINSDERFEVAGRATNGSEALTLMRRNTYDAVVLDVNMPVMNGLELLDALRKENIAARVMMASTDTKEGAKTTLEALSLGALDFIHKPAVAGECRLDNFKDKFLKILSTVCMCKLPTVENREAQAKAEANTNAIIELARKHSSNIGGGDKLVAIASSTGGPKALQSVIPKLPADLNAPVLLVQHMPKGFTASLAERLNELSPIKVTEAKEGDTLEKGHVYIAMGGMHMNVKVSPTGSLSIHYTDEPTREGVKPCANYMYESLAASKYKEIVCVVLTGMGADGTEGIKNLKKSKKIHVITQDQPTCTVYGMPKSVVQANLSDQAVPLETVAQEIIMQVGVIH